MILYLDSSALVKLYVTEPGSDTVRRLVDTADVSATSAIAYAEVRAALARRHREGDISTRDLGRIKPALLSDWEALFVVPVTGAVALTAGGLSEQYAIRGMDSVHLASALWLGRRQTDRVTFAAWDERLAAAAEQAGLTVAGAGRRP